ncbi:Phosphatidylinositol 4-kinase pik1alpha (PI4-kinase)(PtdIns-4-kinase) [Gurleya vavrai]
MQNTEPKLWLHRLFNSEYFETWLLVSYLYRYTTPGIHFYLVCKLRLRPKEEILKVLPHLVHICNTHNSSPLFYFLCDQSIECFFQVREYEEMSLRIIKKFKKKSKFIQNRKEEKKFVFKSTEKKYFNLENLSYKSFPCPQIPYENKNSINLQGILLHITETIALIFDTKLCDNLDNYKKIFKTKEIKKVHKKEESLFSGKIFRKNNLILPTILFMDELVNISKRLKLLPRNIRQKGLEIEIGMLNYNLPADVFLMGSEDKKVVNVVSEFSFVLDSAENSPFFVVFELVNRNVKLDEKNFIIEEEIEDYRNKQIKETDQKPVNENGFVYNFNHKNNIGLSCKDPELIYKSLNSDQKLIECCIDNSNDIKLHEAIKVKKYEDYDNYTVKKENFLETIIDRHESDIDKNNINEDQKEIKPAFTKFYYTTKSMFR